MSTQARQQRTVPRVTQGLVPAASGLYEHNVRGA